MKNFFKNNNTGAEQINANTEAIELLSEALDTEIANRQAGDTELETDIDNLQKGVTLPYELRQLMNRVNVPSTNRTTEIYATNLLSGTSVKLNDSSSNPQDNYARLISCLNNSQNAPYDIITLNLNYDSAKNPIAEITLQDTKTPTTPIKKIDLLNMQPKLTAGEGISISDSNVISASGSGGGGIQSTVVYGASNLFNELNNIIQNNQQTPLAIKWETRSEKTCNEVIGSLGASGTISLQQIDSQFIIGNSEILFLNIGSVGISEIYLTGNYQTNNFSLKIGSGLNTVGYISNSFSFSTQYSNGYFNYFDGEFDTTDDVFTIYYI